MNNTVTYHEVKTYDTPCPICEWYSDMREVEMYPTAELITVCHSCADNIDEAWADETEVDSWSLEECIRCTKSAWVNFLGLCSSCEEESSKQLGLK